VLADNDLQAELAAAFREQADPVSAAPIDSAGIFQRAAHRRRRRRVAVRAGSVLAVLAVAVAGASVGVSVLSRTGRPVPGPAGQPPGLLLDAALAAAPSASAAVSGMPPYYVTADHGRPVAEVRDSATGKALSVIPLPAGIDPKMTEAAAAGNDRTFVLALFFSQRLRTRFYLMRVAAGGRSARLAPLAIPGLPAGAVADAIAVSADGRRLAVSVQFSGGSHGAVEVASLGTGAVRMWTTGQAGLPEDLTWADGGRVLGFFWQDTGPTGGSPRTSASGLWRLDTTAPGTNLMSGRRILPEFEGGDDVQSAVLTPDGSRVIASVTYDGVGHVGRGTVVGGIAELSARTGHPLRTLLAEHALPPDPGQPGWAITSCTLVAADATGNHLLVSCDRFGRLDHARFTPLPGVAPQTAIAAAW
jgi:hypothetical protein